VKVHFIVQQQAVITNSNKQGRAQHAHVLDVMSLSKY